MQDAVSDEKIHHGENILQSLELQVHKNDEAQDAASRVKVGH